MGSANIKASVTPLVPKGQGSPITGSSQSQLRASGQRILGSLAGSLASDIDNIMSQLNNLYTLGQISPTISQFLLTDAAGQIIAAVGPVTYQGVPFTNYFSEIHAGDPLKTRNPANAVFNANVDGSVTVGGMGWLDIHDAFEGNAAWLGARNDRLSITGAANNGSGLIRLQIIGHTLATGNTPQVRNMQYYGVPNALGTWTVTKIDADHVDLQNSVWAGVFAAPSPLPAGVDTYSPTIDRILQVTSAVSAAGLIKLGTSAAHTYETGDRVNVPVIPGVAAATGQWTIKVVDATHFTLDGSTFSGTFTGNGTCLRYFAGMLAQTIAIGNSFTDYNLRAFADGTLEIKNASIILTSANGEIVIDPTVPEIVFTSFIGGGVITIDASVPDIVISGDNTLTTLGNRTNPVATGTAAMSVEDETTHDTAWVGPNYIGLADTGNSSIIAMQNLDAAGNDSGFFIVATNYNDTQFTVDAAAARVQMTDGTFITSITPTAIAVNSTSGLASYAVDVTGDVNVTGVYRAGTTPGISPTITYMTGITTSTGSFGISLSVNTSATGVFGTPGVGQSSGTVVTGVTLNLGTALTGVTPSTASNTFKKGIIVS